MNTEISNGMNELSAEGNEQFSNWRLGIGNIGIGKRSEKQEKRYAARQAKKEGSAETTEGSADTKATTPAVTPAAPTTPAITPAATPVATIDGSGKILGMPKMVVYVGGALLLATAAYLMFFKGKGVAA